MNRILKHKANFLLLLLLAAWQLPLPPTPPSQPGSRAEAEKALGRAVAIRKAALAAEQAARARAKAAAETRDRLAAARTEAAARLAETEQASGAVARSLAALAARRRAAEQDLAAKTAALAPLLPLLERISLYPAVTLLAVPEPPEQTLRGALVIGGLARRIEADAALVRQEQQKVAALSHAIDAKLPELAAAEKRQRAATDALDRSIAQTTIEETAARSAAGDAAAEAAEAAGKEANLRGMIAALIEAARRRAAAEAKARAEAAARAKADAEAKAAAAAALAAQQAKAREQQVALAEPHAPPLPHTPGTIVAGVLVSRFGAATPAGPASGVRYATAPGAHVFAPCAGTIEFAAPFRSYGRLVILDCGHGTRFVLAGMQKLLVTAGASVAEGDALGVMANWDPAQAVHRPTLYVELHRGEVAVDPLPWMQARG